MLNIGNYLKVVRLKCFVHKLKSTIIALKFLINLV